MLMSSVAANAVEVTPYLKIARDYEANAIKATKNWVGKTICIEAEVVKLYIGDKGNAVVQVFRKDTLNSLRGAEYLFSFDGIPDEVTEIEKGDTVKISGRVFKLRWKSFGFRGDILLVRSASSHIVK